MAAVGATQPFTLTPAAETLVFTKDPRETRLPSSIVIANTGVVSTSVNIRWFSYEHNLTYYISKGFQIEAGQTRSANVRRFATRDNDKLLVTSSGAADCHVYLEEAGSPSQVTAE